MSFLKYANAVVAKPVVSADAWEGIRAKSTALGSPFDLKTAANQRLSEVYQPDKYLLSHCTIIASVDTEMGPGSLGRQIEGGTHIDRRFQDYYVTPATSKYVNSNNDAWSRPLLLATFRSFIGANNFVEHLQVQELSKGRIIDAVARDIGDSIYVDILVATELRHRPLIAAIQSGQLQTLSMGCSCLYTVCSKCGNVGEDETQLCSHIRFSKGNTFVDELGKIRKICELVGHASDRGSCKFIEASWVGNPAFKGAVIRSILSPEESAFLGPEVQRIFSLPSPIMDSGAMAKAAYAQGQDAGAIVGKARTPAISRRMTVTAEQQAETGQSFDFGDTEKKDAPKDDPMEKAIGDLSDHIREKAIEKVRGEMNKQDLPPRSDLQENQNNTMIREAVSKSPEWRRIAATILARTKNPEIARRILHGLLLFKNGGWKAVREANTFTGKEILGLSRVVDLFETPARIAGENRIYRTILAVGGLSSYRDVDGYMAACRRVVGRELTTSEKDALLSKGQLFELGIS